METTPFVTIAIAFGSAKRLENLRWRNRFPDPCAGAGPQIDLATALGEESSDLSGGPQGRALGNGGSAVRIVIELR